MEHVLTYQLDDNLEMNVIYCIRIGEDATYDTPPEQHEVEILSVKLWHITEEQSTYIDVTNADAGMLDWNYDRLIDDICKAHDL